MTATKDACAHHGASRALSCVGTRLCILLLILSIFFQKIALPGSGGRLPISVLGLAVLTATGLLLGYLRFSLPALGGYLLFLVIAMTSFMFSTSVELSLSSVAFLAIVQLPLVMRLAPGTVDYERLLRIFNDVMAALAVVAVAQFGAQFVIGPSIAFLIDHHSPPALFLEGFNRLNTLGYGSEILKSNGFFMAEPSFLSQYLALGLFVEVVTRLRPGRMAIYAAGLFVTFSGTGLLMLAIAMPVVLIRRHGPLVPLALAAGIGTLYAAADAMGLDFFTDRVLEFGTPGTSGFARFVSPFVIIGEWVLRDPVAFWVGRGPGTVQEHFDQLPYEAFDPTWAKITYEYGLLGLMAYAYFFFKAIRGRSSRALAIPLTITYVLLGGYVSNAFIVSLLVVFLCWTAEEEAHSRTKPLFKVRQNRSEHEFR